MLIPSPQFRVLLLRRLRRPLPLAPGHSHCGQPDPLGDHRAACATAGAGPGDPASEGAGPCLPRGGGPSRPEQNVRLADMNIDAPVQDARRIEVVCNGLPLWHGAQLAVDATIVSLVGRTREPRAGADAQPAVALDQAAQRKAPVVTPTLS